MKRTSVWVVAVVVLAALPGVSSGIGYSDTDNLLLNKTINAQHAWYGSGGLGVLVDSSPGSWYQFSEIHDNYTPDPDMRVSVSGFDSAVGTVRYWGSAYANPGGNRALNGVTIYCSSTSTTSLDPIDYTRGVHFDIPLETNGGNPMPAGWASAAEGAYYDFAYSAPGGTQSLLFMFENAGIAGNFANEIYKLQAFAAGAPTWPDYLAGDFNKDGEVGPEDFGILKDNFGLDSLPFGLHESWTLGDANDDGEIGPEDFGLLKDNFGLDGGPTGTYPLTNVPEPVSLALLAAALPMLWKRRA
ncbi:MAG: hypothetical protein NTV86_04150 [Planctomycetota bacterium]|nr:hypothetical protein [Planctomycetota bacterium]